MDKDQFLNKIYAGCDQISEADLGRYFSDYTGPFDTALADEYIRYFSKHPEELSRNAERGISHREALIENGMLQVNNPL